METGAADAATSGKIISHGSWEEHSYSDELQPDRNDGQNSRGRSRSRSSRLSRLSTKPIQPTPPFELFADYMTRRVLEEEGISDDYDLSARIREQWESMDSNERQHWDAQYGKQVLEFLEKIGRWRRENPVLPQPQRRFKPFDILDIDIDRLIQIWEELMDKLSKELHGQGDPEDDSRSQVKEGPSLAQEDAQSGVHVVYRAELYRVQLPSPGYRGPRKLQAKLERLFEHKSQISVTGGSRSADDSAPIFEVTTMYAAPEDQKDGMNLRNFRRLMKRAGEGVLDPEPVRDGVTIEVRAEAGVILTIGSEFILDAVRKIAPDYPDLVYEGEALVISEPFCLFLHYRDTMLEYKDQLLQLASTTETRDVQAEDNGTNAVSTEKLPLELLGDGRQSSKDQAMHIAKLYEFLDSRYLSLLSQEEERHQRPSPMCTFEWAWLLYKPESLVYTWDDDVLTACIVDSYTLKGLFNHDRETKKPTVRPRRLHTRRKLKFKHELEAIVVTLSYMEFDGIYLGRRTKTVTIWPYEGEKAIISLPAFPTEYWKDASIRDRMIRRGKKYYALTKRTHCQYHGQTLSSPRRTVHSRIMIDSETYYSDRKYGLHRLPRLEIAFADNDYSSEENENSRSRSPVRRYIREVHSGSDTESDPEYEKRVINIPVREYRKKVRAAYHRSGRSGFSKIPPVMDPKDTKSLPDELYMLCARQVYAYILMERKWDLLDVEHIIDCVFNENMMDDLVLFDEAKELIQALSSTYVIRNENFESKSVEPVSPRGRWSADFVQNKGDGQILLLHGKPGVGKTTTAECVAEITKRPLVAITCGDLGTDAPAVERALNKWLQLGTLWNAVLLFDEADVYLESRERGDLYRNTLVSIFLRALEYYQGLLFLTSNRVGTFDEAIISRVHVILHYPDFSDAERERIWETSFRKLGEERSDIKLGVGVVDYAYSHPDIKAVGWNGREIRNAFNTMVALAEWDAKQGKRLTKDGKIELKRKHLQQVVKMSDTFKRYLHSTRGFDDSKLAKLHLIRDDKFLYSTNT